MYLKVRNFRLKLPCFRRRCALLLLVLVSLNAAAFAGDEILRVAYVSDAHPLQFTDERGEAAGILPDLWRLWSDRTGRDLVFLPGTLKETRAWLKEGKADAHAGLLEEGPESGLGFGTILQPADIHFFHHHTLYQVREAADLRPFRIGILAGDASEEALLARLSGGGTLLRFNTVSELGEALAKGEIRVVVGDSTVILQMLEVRKMRDEFRYNPVRPLEVQSYRVASATGREDLLEELQAGFRDITGQERGDIETRWLGRIREAALDKLIVGLPSEWFPLSFLSVEGKPAGLLHDLWRLWGRKTGKRIEFELGSWAEILRKVQNHEVDILAGLLISDYRADFLEFSEPFYPISSRLYARTAEHANLTLQQLSGERVGVVLGSYFEDMLSSRYPGIEIVTFPSESDLLQGILDGEAFAGVAPTIIFEPIVARRGVEAEVHGGTGTLLRSQLHAAVLDGRGELLSLVDEGLSAMSNAELVAVENRWIADPRSRYFQPREEILLLTEEEKKWLAANPFILYAIHPNNPPVEFLDRNGYHQGIARDYLKLVGERLGVVFEQIPVANWEDAYQKALRREADLLPALAIDEERRGTFLFTSPYLTLPTVMVVRAAAAEIGSLRDLAGKQVASVPGQPMPPAAQDPAMGVISVPMENLSQALKALSLGEIDAVFTNMAAASYEINRWQITNLRIAEELDTRTEVAFAIRTDWPLLHTALDKALASLSPAERANIESRWISMERQTWKPATEQVVAVLMLLLLFLVSLYWNQKLSVQVRKRREAERALRASEERLGFALQAAEEGIWDRDLETGQSHFSPRFWEMLGYDPEEMKRAGKAGFMDLVHEKDRALFLDGIPRSLAEDEKADGWNLEFRMQSKVGDYRWILSRGLVVSRNFDGAPSRVVATHLDITSRRMAEHALRVSEQRMRALGDNLVDGLVYQISVPPDGDVKAARIEYVSAGLEQMVGITPEELRENPFRLHERIHPGDIESYQRGQWEAIQSRSVFRHEVRVMDGEGRYRWMQFRSSPRIDPEGRLVFDGLMIDTTDRKNAEAAMGEAKEEADQANRAKSEFLANMSHEIRTPMNAIVGMSHLVLQTDLNAKQHDYITKIQSSSHRLLGILNDILDFSKIEAGKLEIEKVPFNLEDVFGDLSNLVSLKAEEKGLELVFKISRGVPVRLIGDPLRLGQILVNLTNNAVKFTEYGEIVVSISEVPKAINSEDPKVELKFTVRDSGIGMTEEQVHRLFQSFSQADSSITRKYGGTGLGLAISRRLVDMMGGKMQVSSEYGKGSRFVFTLPFLLDEKAEPVMEESMRKLPVRRALLADDNETAREYLGDQLQRFGIEVESFDSGESLLARLDGVKEPPAEVVFLDWKMPGLSGLEAARRLRDAWSVEQLPVILLVSAFGREEVMEHAAEAGVCGFMTKPVTA